MASAVGLALLLALAPSAFGTTLQRVGLDHLVTDSSDVVVGEVVDAYSYWSDGGEFILTDVVVMPEEYLKGGSADDRGVVVVTLPGGEVGELTHLVVGGPALHPGRSYVLFLGDEELPGKGRGHAVRGMVQGVFDVEGPRGQERAVSQGNSHPLVADPQGRVTPPGGAVGLRLRDLKTTVREMAGGERVEVRR